MALSPAQISAIEGYPSEIALFSRSGVIHIVWASQDGMKRTLWWKPATGANFSEVQAGFYAQFKNLAVTYRVADDTLLLTWDDDRYVYQAVVLYSTGAVIQPETRLFEGVKATVLHRGGVAGPRLLLTYIRQGKSIYLRESSDFGATWGGERPILNNKVLDPRDLVVFPYGDEHLSICQIGSPARSSPFLSTVSRTRPLAGIVADSTTVNRYLACEPTQNGTNLSDNIRSLLLLSRVEPKKLYHVAGTRQGVDDSLEQIVVYSTIKKTPSAVASVANAGAVGRSVTPFSLGLVAETPIALPAGAEAISGDISENYLYVAQHSDTTPNTDMLSVVDLVAGTSTAFLSGLEAARAIGVGFWESSNLPFIFAAIREGGQEYLKVFRENGTTPTLLSSSKLQARAYSLKIVMTGPASGRLYVGLADRLNIYAIDSLDTPLRLFSIIPIITRGRVLDIKLAPNGNIVCALGEGGIAVFNETGETLAQTVPGGLSVAKWERSKSYALGALVVPDKHPYRFAGTYFRCSTAGTSGSNEPSWAAGVTSLADNTARWEEVASVDPVVTSVELHPNGKTGYAVGLAGGPKGTAGRLWAFSTKGLSAQVPGYIPPPEPPEAPRNVVVTAPTISQVVISWDAAATATSYRVYRSYTAYVPGDFLGETSETTFEDTTALGNSDVYYTVSSVSEVGESDPGFETKVHTVPNVQGHILDADTVGLWRLEDAILADHGVAERPTAQYHASSSDSWMERTTTWALAGTVEFDYWSQGEGNYDGLLVYVDGVEKLRVYNASGLGGRQSISVASGSHTVRFQMHKDGSADVGLDTAYVDNVVFKAGDTVFESYDFEADATDATPAGWTGGGYAGGWVKHVQTYYDPFPDLATPAHPLTALSSSTVGKIGRGVNFLGSSYIKNAADDTLRAIFLNAFTVEMWVYITAGNLAQDYRGVFGMQNGSTELFGVWTKNGKIGPHYVVGSWQEGILCPMLSDAWVHVAVRVTPLSSSQVTVDTFINGSKTHTQTLSRPTSYNGQVLEIGRGHSAQYYFTGSLDDVRLSKVARTDEEILTSYNRGIGRC